MSIAFNSHMAAAIVLGLVFLATQFGCLIWYRRWLGSETMRLASIGELRGSAHPTSGPGESDWVGWVSLHFAEGAKQHGNFARDDAFQELNWRLSTRLPLAILHKLGVIAPLLGVIITATGFFSLRMPSFETAGTSDIFRTIQPVVIGILLGAFLSILNQGFLLRAEWESDVFREEARRWFDDRVWPLVVTREESTNRRAADSMERTATRLGEFARIHQMGANAAIDATGVIDRSAAMIREAVAAVSTEWRSSVGILSETCRSVEASTRRFAKLIPEGGRLTDRMVNSVDRFGEIVETRFAERVRLQERAAIQLAESAETLGTVVTGLDAGTRGMIEHGARQKEAVEAFLKTFTEAVIPGQARFVSTSSDLNTTVDGLKQRVGQLDKALRGAAEALTGAIPDFQRVFSLVEATTGQFRSLVDGDLSTAARRHKETIEDWSGVARSTEEVVCGLRDATSPLGSLVDGFRISGRALQDSIENHVKPANEQLLANAVQLSTTTGRLATSLDTMDRSFDRTTEAFSKLTERASATFDRLSPSFDRFGSIVIDLLGPAAETQRVAAETQRAAAESTAQAFALVRDSATGIVEATRAIRDLIARQLEDAATVKISADALRAATDWLRQTGDAVQGVLSDDLPPLEAAIRDAVIRLREATDGLGVVVVDSSGRVEQQLQGIDQSLERVHSLIDGLRPIVSSGPEVAGLLDGLGGHFSRLTDGVTMLSGRFEDLSHNLHRRRSLFGG